MPKKREDWRFKKPSEWSDADVAEYMDSDDYASATEQMKRAGDVKSAAQAQEENAKKKRKRPLAAGAD